jgi:alkylation response protein AidB-like acyl-CoA dehydrogenase
VTQPTALAERTGPAPRKTKQSDELIERARGLIPYLREKSDQINAARRVPDDVMQRVSEAGLMNILRPRRFGGMEAPIEAMYRIGQQLAMGDGSMGWVYVVLGAHDQFMSFYPKDVQEEYWASERPVCASTYNPTGKAVAVPGGFKLSGKWSFCSGIDFCDWVVPGGIVGMLPGEKPMPDMRFFLVHKSQFKLVDDWDVMGLCGTGSKTILLDDAFVPSERVISETQIVTNTTPGASVLDGPTYRAPAWTVFVFGFPLVGAAIVRSAYEDIRADFRGRAQRREPLFELRKPAVQVHLTEASVLLDSADLLIDRAMKETFDQAYGEGSVARELRIRNRRDLIYAVLNARRAGEILMSMSGGRGIMTTGRVQRAMRDIYALSAHPSMNWDIQSLSYGSVELGGDITDPIL